MDYLSLGDKVNAIKACEILIDSYENDLKKAIDDGLKESKGDAFKSDYTTLVMQKIELYRNVKDEIIEGLKNDSALLDIVETQGKGFSK